MPQSNNDPFLEDNYTFRHALNKRKEDVVYLWSNKFKIALVCFLGACIGLLIAWKWPVTYTARLTFVVEESKAGGSGLLSSLAGSFGMDLGSVSGANTGSVLAGDNVLQLLISQKMVRQTFLTPFDKDSSYTLADKYADVYNLKEKWLEKTNNNPISFPSDRSNYNRLQDSLLSIVVQNTIEKQISVNKPDKKLSFFALSTTMKNEDLASRFCERLIKQASKFYIQTKTKKARTNIDILEHRADSIGRILNKKTLNAAGASENLLDLNPAYATATVSSEVQERDKRVMQTYYAEIIKNLEASRTVLSQETPTFQIVDEPELPLKKNRIKYSSAGLAGIFLSGAAFAMFLLFKKPD